jgi:hypothetical protein
VQRDTSPPSATLAFFTFMMLLAAVTNWEPHGVTLAGYCYAMRRGMKAQNVTPFLVSHLQRYGVTVRCNITSVYPPLAATHVSFRACATENIIITGKTIGYTLSLVVAVLTSQYADDTDQHSTHVRSVAALTVLCPVPPVTPVPGTTQQRKVAVRYVSRRLRMVALSVGQWRNSIKALRN